MNIIFIVLSLILTVSHNDNSSDYVKAYEYVSSLDSTEIILVSDTIVYLELITFYEELGEVNNISLAEMIVLLEEKDNLHRFESFYMDLEVLREKITSNPSHILFFSKKIDNYLVAELFKIDSEILSFKNIKSFNSSKKFLFEFDCNNQISKVYMKEIEYD
jgi:hypothetical protein